mgnify:CR=1 FL=1
MREREQIMSWWKSLNNNERALLTKKYFIQENAPNRNFDSLIYDDIKEIYKSINK